MLSPQTSTMLYSSRIPRPNVTRAVPHADCLRRANGRTISLLAAADTSAPAATPPAAPSQIFAPAALISYTTKAASPIIEAYARLKTLVTPNCIVKPTPEIARMDAVTRPNPIASTKALIRRDPSDHARSLVHLYDLANVGSTLAMS